MYIGFKITQGTLTQKMNVINVELLLDNIPWNIKNIYIKINALNIKQ